MSNTTDARCSAFFRGLHPGVVSIQYYSVCGVTSRQSFRITVGVVLRGLYILLSAAARSRRRLESSISFRFRFAESRTYRTAPLQTHLFLPSRTPLRRNQL